MRKLLALFLLLMTASSTASAQDGTLTAPTSSHAVAYNSLRDNWFLQAGLDLSLQNPYGYSFSKVFPNGWSMGLDIAGGRWFTPELGARVKVNWENSIPLFENKKANWIAPFYQPGVNMDRGGYVSAVGDVMLDLHNIIAGYDEERRWNLQVFPRAGLIYNMGVEKGSPLIGIGVGNTYRINDRIGLYCDVAYQMVSSGFTGCYEGTNTGMGTNANAFMDIDAGVQFNLTGSRFKRKGDVMVCRSFWDDWFLQFGLDMTLQNPYKHPFRQSFKKGRTFGFDGAFGKRFSPDVAMRFRLNWENGFPIFENKHLEWVAPSVDENGVKGPNGINMDKGGIITAYMDLPLSLINLFGTYDAERRWDVLFFPRAGLGSNIATGSCSPMVGFGGGATYRLTPRLSLYADMAYQVITSEFTSDVAGTGMGVSFGANGFLDLHAGVQIDLGK